MSTRIVLPERFIAETTRMARRTRHFSVTMMEHAARQRAMAEGSFDGSDNDVLVERLCREFFLPFFKRAGFCLFSSFATPPEIIPEAGGFTVAPHEVGWEIRSTTKSIGRFPYWRTALKTPPYDLIVRVDLETSASLLEQMLSRAWDPIVYTNVHISFPTKSIFDFIRKTTNRSTTRLWLIYELGGVSQLSILIIGSGPTVAEWYGTALRVTQLSRSYYALGPAWQT